MEEIIQDIGNYLVSLGISSKAYCETMETLNPLSEHTNTGVISDYYYFYNSEGKHVFSIEHRKNNGGKECVLLHYIHRSPGLWVECVGIFVKGAYSRNSLKKRLLKCLI